MSTTIVEGLAQAFTALTGMEAISLGSKIMVNNSGTWASVGTDTIWQIVKGSGAKIVGATPYPVHNGVLGSFSGLEYEAIFDVGGAQLKNCLATPTQLSNGMRAALQNGGAQIGNTALSPVTDLVVQSTGSGQQVAVTTKGVLAKVAFETALTGAAAALGVTIGVGIVETNPTLVTKIYNRLAGTDIDPEYIADIVENTTVWENIRDGVTFLSEDFINVVKDIFIEEGVYESSIPEGGEYYSIDGIEVPVISGNIDWSSVPWAYTSSLSIGRRSDTNEAFYSVSRGRTAVIKTNELQEFVYIINNNANWKTSTSGIVNNGPTYYIFSNYPFRFRSGGHGTNYKQSTGTFVDVEIIDIETAMSKSNAVYVNVGETHEVSPGVSGGAWNKTIPASRSNEKVLPFSAPVIVQVEGLTPAETAAQWFENHSYPVITPSTPGDTGVSPKPGAVYPTAGNTLAQDYPDWDSDSVETISDWNENTQQPNKRKWYPINSKADQSTGQDSAQDGTVNENDISDAVNNIDQALEENSDIAPDVETQPDIYPNPNPAPGTDLYPVTPNPPDIDASDGEDPDPTIPILTTVATSGLAHIYNPTLGEVQSLGAALWTPSLIENIKKIFVNPMDGIIGFHILYATPKTGTTEEIVLGYYGTGVQSKVVTNQYVEVDCGYVAVDEWWNDARDYEPYVNVSLYLPFIGIVPLKANDVIGSHVKVKYHVDVLTGTCLAMVEIQKYNARGTLYQFVGNCAITIPLSSGNYTAVITSLLSVASSAVGGAAIGGVGGALFGAFKGAAINAGRAKLQVIQSGNLGANAGAMGIRNPFLIIRRPMTKDAYAYNMQYGYPAFKWVTLGQVSGFTRVKSVHLNDVKCTDEEKEMIESALKEGVIL